MDEKLARGCARELFRRLVKSTNRDTNPTTATVANLLRTYLMDGGVDETQLVPLASRLESVLASVDNVFIDSRRIKHPIKNKIIVETTSAVCIKGEEQRWMVASVVTRVLQRNVLKVIETAHHVAISEHAVFRIFERGDINGEFTIPLLERATLWTPVILFALFGHGTDRPVDDGTGIAIPFAGGLLLGTIETNHMEGPDQGPTITSFKRGGHKLRRIKAPFQLSDNRIPTIGINTYVSRDELFENQLTVFDLLEKFAEQHRIPMVNMRRLCALGYPDAEITKVLGPIQFDEIDAKSLIELGGHIRNFFDTPEWKTHANSHRPRARFLQ